MTHNPSQEAAEHQQDPHKDRHHKIAVKVKYVGDKPFHQEFEATQTVGAVKLAALKHFNLEVAMAEKYVLKQDGRDLKDTMLMAKFDAKHVDLDLCLIAEVPKG
jgi:hypothetical protein